MYEDVDTKTLNQRYDDLIEMRVKEYDAHGYSPRYIAMTEELEGMKEELNKREDAAWYVQDVAWGMLDHNDRKRSKRP